jgi:allantoinase
MILRNTLAALPGENDFRKVDVVISQGKIREIVSAGSARIDEGEIFEASGLMMFPGAIDAHVHFDEPGYTHREDFYHGSSEAARGGVTTVVDMPCTSIPPITDLKALETKREIVRNQAVVDYAFFGGINGSSSSEEMEKGIRELAQEVVGFKCYAISGMESFRAVTPSQFSMAISLCKDVGRPLLLHAEDPATIAKQMEKILARTDNSQNTWKDYCFSRPMEAEEKACELAIRLAGDAAEYLHVVHVGTARAAELVAAAKGSCETCAHYLAFDENDFERKGATLKTAPPVKATSQKALLWRLLADGTIAFMASDHAGAPDYEKFTDDPFTAYGGIPGTGTMFPYLLSEGLFAGRLDLPRFLDVSSQAAAKRYGLHKGKGAILPGLDADFVLVDPNSTSLVDPDSMYSKNRITAFAGMRLAGSIVATFVRGTCVYGNGTGGPTPQRVKVGDFDRFAGRIILVSRGFGKFLTWGYL